MPFPSRGFRQTQRLQGACTQGEGRGCRSLWVMRRSGWLPCLFVGLGSLFLRGVSQYCMYDTDDAASLLTQKGSFTLHLTDLFAKGA